LNLDINGAQIVINAVIDTQNGQTNFYLNPAQVLNIKLPDLKVVATKDDLYNVIDELIDTLTNTDIVSVITKMLSTSTTSVDTETIETEGGNDTEGEEETVSESTKSGIVDIIYSLLTFNVNDAFACVKSNDKLTATLYLDSLVSQLGLDLGVEEGDSLGTVVVDINHSTHAIKTSGTNPVLDRYGNTYNAEWISLASELTERKKYDLDKTEYIDVSFVSTLLSDVVNFATDNDGNMYKMFTFNGTVNVSIISMISIKIEISTLTIGFDENNNIYFTLIGNLTGSLVTNTTLGLTYHDGYITIAKNLDSTPLYRVMTLDYFIDHMFDTDDTSPILWLLGVSKTIWKTVVNQISGNLNISSGIENTKDVYLYNQTTTSQEKVISMYDFVSALSVKLGNYYSGWGESSTIESKLGVSDNYYGFELKAGVITNDVLTSLIAAITRTEEKGLSGIKAYGAISSYVTFSVDLEYVEGLTEENYYVPTTTLTSGKSAPSLYKYALKEAADDNITIDFNHSYNNEADGYKEVFGCYNTSDNSIKYSHALYTHDVTVIGIDGEATVYEIRHGSKLYLYNNDSNSLVYTDDNGEYRLVYSYDQAGTNLAGKYITINGDITIYATARESVKLYLYNNGNYVETYNTFVGDDLPTTISGGDVIEAFALKDGTLASTLGTVKKSYDGYELYGVFANSEVQVNGVMYTFDKSTKSYIVSGKGTDFELYDYYGDKVLELENEINGYKVTAIAEMAFANTASSENKASKTIKSVLVPSNITRVGENAFLDNFGIKQIIFLAEQVTFVGSASDKTMPLYGCSTEDSGTTTSLVVYYNNIYVDGSGSWNTFRMSSGWFSNTYYLVGSNGGTLYNSGSWSYIKLTITNSTDLQDIESLVNGYIASGLQNYAYTQAMGQSAKAYFESNVDLENYVVTVEVTKSYGYTCVNVTFAKNEPAEINVYSAVEFNYDFADNSTFNVGEGKLKVLKIGETLRFIAPTATNSSYTFLGWTVKDVNGNEHFIGDTIDYVESNTYRAIWGISNVGASYTISKVTTSGTSPEAPVGNDVNGLWYSTTAFDTQITDISQDADGLLYTRSVYTLTYTISVFSYVRNFVLYEDKTEISNDSSVTFTMNFLEGQQVSLYLQTNYTELIVEIAGKIIHTYTISYSYFGTKNNFRDANSNVSGINKNIEAKFTY
jgi:hypothetical protein